MKEEIVAAINNNLDTEVLEVELSGNHCSVLVVSESFDGLNQVKRQQAVYACLNNKIASGEIHAVNIKALTPDQWRAAQ